MKRPPYARLFAKRAANSPNRNQSHWVLIGSESWETAREWEQQSHRVFTVSPPDADPSLLDWSMYRHASPPVGIVRCGWVDGDQLRCLVKALLAAGSPNIYDILGDTVYRRAVKGKAA
jgi:hypothetical protein